MDPGAVPEALQDLTTLEQMLIAPVAPVMSVMRLPEYHGGQWRFKGHVICFPQDIQPVVSVLPHVSIDVLVLRSHQSANADAVREFCVRRQRVHDALLWLMEHMEHISVSVENLEQLPDDDPLQLRLDQYMTEPGGSESEDVGSCPTAPWDVGSMSSSFALDAQGHFSETANIARVTGLSPQSVEATDWPSRGSQPINEFNREGYITQAFPALFSRRAPGYLAPRLVQTFTSVQRWPFSGATLRPFRVQHHRTHASVATG